MLESVFEHMLPGNPGMRERERIVGNVSNKRSYVRLVQDVYSFLIYNGQKMEMIQLSINGWMDKQSVSPHNGILLVMKGRRYW